MESDQSPPAYRCMDRCDGVPGSTPPAALKDDWFSMLRRISRVGSLADAPRPSRLRLLAPHARTRCSEDCSNSRGKRCGCIPSPSPRPGLSTTGGPGGGSGTGYSSKNSSSRLWTTGGASSSGGGFSSDPLSAPLAWGFLPNLSATSPWHAYAWPKGLHTPKTPRGCLSRVKLCAILFGGSSCFFV
eukprot:123760-Prymnesium_polylepis.2